MNRRSGIRGSGPTSTRKIDDDVHSFFEPRRGNRLTFRGNQSHIVSVGKDENGRRFSFVGTGIPLAESASDDISLPHIFFFTPNHDGPTNFFRSSLSNRPIAPMRRLCIFLEPFFKFSFGRKELAVAIGMFLSMKNSLRSQPSSGVFRLFFSWILSKGGRRQFKDAESTKETVAVAALIKLLPVVMNSSIGIDDVIVARFKGANLFCLRRIRPGRRMDTIPSS